MQFPHQRKLKKKTEQSWRNCKPNYIHTHVLENSRSWVKIQHQKNKTPSTYFDQSGVQKIRGHFLCGANIRVRDFCIYYKVRTFSKAPENSLLLTRQDDATVPYSHRRTNFNDRQATVSSYDRQEQFHGLIINCSIFVALALIVLSLLT